MLIGGQNIWSQTRKQYREATLQLFMYYMDAPNRYDIFYAIYPRGVLNGCYGTRWKDPCFTQVIRWISKVWMLPDADGDEEAIGSALALASAFSRACKPLSASLPRHMGFSLDQIFTRYTHAMARKGLYLSTCVAHLTFFMSWPSVDGSKTFLDHCLRSSCVSQTVECIVGFDQLGDGVIIAPPDIKDRFTKLQELFPVVWMRMLVQRPTLDLGLRNAEMKKCVEAGMVSIGASITSLHKNHRISQIGWIIPFLLLSKRIDPVAKIGEPSTSKGYSLDLTSH